MALTRVVHDWANKKTVSSRKTQDGRRKRLGFVSQKREKGYFVSVVMMLASVDLVEKETIFYMQDRRRDFRGSAFLFKTARRRFVRWAIQLAKSH